MSSVRSIWLVCPLVKGRRHILLVILKEFNPLQPEVAFLYPLKTSEKQNRARKD